jgi:hypothetical protein
MEHFKPFPLSFRKPFTQSTHLPIPSDLQKLSSKTSLKELLASSQLDHFFSLVGLPLRRKQAEN